MRPVRRDILTTIGYYIPADGSHASRLLLAIRGFRQSETIDNRSECQSETDLSIVALSLR